MDGTVCAVVEKQSKNLFILDVGQILDKLRSLL
jgi:hypothetical protein